MDDKISLSVVLWFIWCFSGFLLCEYDWEDNLMDNQDDGVMLIWRQDNKEPADKIIPLLTLLDEEAESKPEEKKDTGQLHSLEDHNYCISRSGHCPYCADGSKPVPGCLITGASD